MCACACACACACVLCVWYGIFMCMCACARVLCGAVVDVFLFGFFPHALRTYVLALFLVLVSLILEMG